MWNFTHFMESDPIRHFKHFYQAGEWQKNNRLSSSSSLASFTISAHSSGEVSSDNVFLWEPPFNANKNGSYKTQLRSGGAPDPQMFLEDRTDFTVKDPFLRIDNSFLIDPDFSFLHGLPAVLKDDDLKPDFPPPPWAITEKIDNDSNLLLSSNKSSDQCVYQGTSQSSEVSSASNSSKLTATKFAVLPNIGDSVVTRAHANVKKPAAAELSEKLQQDMTDKLSKVVNDVEESWFGVSPLSDQWQNSHLVLPPIGQSNAVMKCNSFSDTSLKEKLISDLPTIWEDELCDSQAAFDASNKQLLQQRNHLGNAPALGDKTPLKGLPPMPGLPGNEPPDNVGGIKVKTKDAIQSSGKMPSIPTPPPLIGGGTSGGGGDLSLGGPSPPPPPPPPPPGVPPPPPVGGKKENTRVPGVPNFPGNLPGGLKAKQRHHTKYRLPVLNWSALKPNQVAGTIFNDLDDDSVLNELDLGAFEEMFKTRAQDTEADRARLLKIAEAQQRRGASIIDVNRARNLSITLRKIGSSTDEICRSVYSYDLSTLPLEYVEMLPRFIPNEMELKAFKDYEKSGKSFDALAAEDKFMWLFGRVERLQQRLNIMIFLGNFNDSVMTLTPQIAAVIAASMSIKSSSNLKRVLEIILAVGNYMNSAKRGAVYGFKLQSLDALIDTKSTDKKQTLLHYIVNVIETYYPDIKHFYNELRYVDRACKVSLDNIVTDVNSIKNGMNLTRNEYETHQHPVLEGFIESSQEKVTKVLQDAETAKEAYKNVVEYFGETPKTMPPETFFPMVDRFIKAYQKAEKDLDDWRIADEKRAEKERRAMEQQELKQKKKSKRQDDEKKMKSGEQNLINELRHKQRKDRGAIESKDGAIEDNINFLKSEPYRRGDTVHRSFRKKTRPEATRVAAMSTML
ncbi:unnamed protein product [Clavelina lepadiformis]|uniref:FH2 domain-containing protein n=1 Tax=Clavelina lepadiformis TaxID=159417 RepID=A0ABP0EWI6_CLALP